jgi:hypothetical protein
MVDARDGVMVAKSAAKSPYPKLYKVKRRID